MGIDFGEKRIGLALSDPLKLFAYPFKTILNDENLWKNLESAVSENNVEKIIIGLPAQEEGKITHAAKGAALFINEVKRKFSVEIISWDESFTSVIAKKRVLENTPKKMKRRNKELLDKNAAAVILEEYMKFEETDSLRVKNI